MNISARCLLRFVLSATASLAISSLIGCASVETNRVTATPTPPPALRFHILRHAEKASEPGKDPGLNEVGSTRAERLAHLLRDEPIVAVYATGYRRTQATAASTASAHGLAIRTYEASEHAARFVAKLRREHRRGAVLIVGHSNTTAAIASALCGCAVEPISEHEFDRWIRIEIDVDGKARLSTSRY
jgi:broad specificity phosphatase PhoE